MTTIEIIDNRIYINRGLLEQHMDMMKAVLSKTDNYCEFFDFIEYQMRYARERMEEINKLETVREWLVSDSENREEA